MSLSWTDGHGACRTVPACQLRLRQKALPTHRPLSVTIPKPQKCPPRLGLGPRGVRIVWSCSPLWPRTLVTVVDRVGQSWRLSGEGDVSFEMVSVRGGHQGGQFMGVRTAMVSLRWEQLVSSPAQCATSPFSQTQPLSVGQRQAEAQPGPLLSRRDITGCSQQLLAGEAAASRLLRLGPGGCPRS